MPNADQQGFKSNNGSDPAQPVMGHKDSSGECLHGQLFHGLTKREHFAAMAMQGLTSSANIDVRANSDLLVETSVYIADALLAALEKQQ